jgi:uncharacterized membrane protein YsdA (DUF1294 family)
MSTAAGPPKSRRWTLAAAVLAAVSLACLVLVAGDFGSSALDNDEFRVPVAVLSFLTWLGGLVAATVAARQARKDGGRARWAVAIATFLGAGAVFVVVVIWIVASAGLN